LNWNFVALARDKKFYVEPIHDAADACITSPCPRMARCESLGVKKYRCICPEGMLWDKLYGCVPEEIDLCPEWKCDLGKDYPFTVTIYSLSQTELTLQCSGTILTRRHILTSGSCADSDDPDQYLVYVSQKNALGNLAEGFGVSRVTRLSEDQGDVAVLELSEILPCNVDFISNICVVGPAEVDLQGWAAFSLEFVGKGGLFNTSFTTFENEPCAHYGGAKKIERNEICGLLPSGPCGKRIQGSPLYIFTNGAVMQTGISSHSIKSCGGEVFARVPTFLPWIRENVPGVKAARPISHRGTMKPTTSSAPTILPSPMPTNSPSTPNPSKTPSINPSTALPTYQPTTKPTTSTPTTTPSDWPSRDPSPWPSVHPTNFPSRTPSISSPSSTPTTPYPTEIPTLWPTNLPSIHPVPSPTLHPISSAPSTSPSQYPSITPSLSKPTQTPTTTPSYRPSTTPSHEFISMAFTFRGDFHQIIGKRSPLFLLECSSYLAPIKCIDVRSGSIILHIRGHWKLVERAGNFLRLEGLRLQSFPPLYLRGERNPACKKLKSEHDCIHLGSACHWRLSTCHKIPIIACSSTGIPTFLRFNDELSCKRYLEAYFIFCIFISITFTLTYQRCQKRRLRLSTPFLDHQVQNERDLDIPLEFLSDQPSFSSDSINLPQKFGIEDEHFFRVETKYRT